MGVEQAFSLQRRLSAGASGAPFRSFGAGNAVTGVLLISNRSVRESMRQSHRCQTGSLRHPRPQTVWLRYFKWEWSRLLAYELLIAVRLRQIIYMEMPVWLCRRCSMMMVLRAEESRVFQQWEVV